MALSDPVLASNDEGATDWIETHSHRFFRYLESDNNEDNINIGDIAHSLSMLCRFNGHCEEFYSVAQHSCIVAHYVGKKYKLAALLHDAAEAYIGDIPRPIKQVIPEIKELEKLIEIQISKVFGIPYPCADIIDLVDSRLLITESQQLFRGKVHWNIEGLEPLGYKFETLWSPKEAEKRFLEKFQEYY